MSKQTIPLSQIVDHATNEVHPSPNVKAFQTINKIATTIPSAQIALRVQLIAKMKAYCNKFIKEKEMYYAFCLVDHVVINCQPFRPQVLNKDFLNMFERCCDFERARKGKKVGIVTEKGMEILQRWGTTYGKELIEYRVMFDKYVDKGLRFPIIEPGVEEEQHIPPMYSITEDIEKCKKEIEECEAIIKDNLKYKSNPNGMQSIRNLHKRAVELNSKFNVLYVKFMNEHSDSSELSRYSEIEKHFTDSIHQLANIINNPQGEDKIYKTYTTGHVNFDHHPNEFEKSKFKQFQPLKELQPLPNKPNEELLTKISDDSPQKSNDELLLPQYLGRTTPNKSQSGRMTPNQSHQSGRMTPKQTGRMTPDQTLHGRLTPRQRNDNTMLFQILQPQDGKMTPRQIMNDTSSSIQYGQPEPQGRKSPNHNTNQSSLKQVQRKLSRTNSSNTITLAPPPSRGQPLRLSRQNTEESVSYSQKQSFALKIERTTTQVEASESQVKNRFIFETTPTNLNNTQSYMDTYSNGSIL